MERDMRGAALAFIREHPGYVLEVALLEHAPAARPRVVALVDATPPRRSASRPAGQALGVICFWVFAALALLGARRATAPAFVWLVPLAMYLSVVFLASETPRYRAPLDPFVIVLAALALVTRARDDASVRREALDGD